MYTLAFSHQTVQYCTLYVHTSFLIPNCTIPYTSVYTLAFSYQTVQYCTLVCTHQLSHTKLYNTVHLCAVQTSFLIPNCTILHTLCTHQLFHTKLYNTVHFMYTLAFSHQTVQYFTLMCALQLSHTKLYNTVHLCFIYLCVLYRTSFLLPVLYMKLNNTYTLHISIYLCTAHIYSPILSHTKLYNTVHCIIYIKNFQSQLFHTKPYIYIAWT